MRPFVFLLAFVFAVNGAGAQMLAKRFPYTNGQTFAAMNPTSDGGYIVILGNDVSADAKPVLVKTDSEFNTQWATSITGGYMSDVAHGNTMVMQTQDGGYFVYTVGMSAFNLKFDASGTLLWSKTANLVSGFGSFTYDDFHYCIEKNDGSIVAMASYFSNMFVYQLSPTGTVQWSKKLNATTGGGKNPAFDMLALNDGSVIISGKSGSDNCFARIDNNGNMMWSTVINIGSSYNQPRGIAEMEDGNILVTGEHSMMGDLSFIMKISSTDGSVFWMNTVTDFLITDALYLGANRYAIVGQTNISSTAPDLVISVIDGDGNTQDSKKLVAASDMYDVPKLFSYNNRHFLSATRANTASGSPDECNLYEFDASLTFDCNAIDFNLNKFNSSATIVTVDSLQISNGGNFSNPGCSGSAFSTSVQWTDLCMALAQNETLAFENEMSVYPNPVTVGNSINIQVGQTDTYHINLTDLSGKTIFQDKFNSSTYSLGTQNLSKGIYFITCTGQQNRYTTKISVE